MKVNSLKFDRIVDILSDLAEMSIMLQRHACALIVGGKIMAMSENKDGKADNHSEMNVISTYLSKNKPGNLTKCTLVIIRINRQGELCLSKPCANCVKYLKYYGIKKIFYSSDTGFESTSSDKIENAHMTLYFRRAAKLN
jgi:deoxycytidylate deaminase